MYGIWLYRVIPRVEDLGLTAPTDGLAVYLVFGLTMREWFDLEGGMSDTDSEMLSHAFLKLTQ